MPKLTRATINEIMLAKGGSYEAGSEDVQGHTLYDTLNIVTAATSNQYQFFSTPQSSTKTLQQTNMTDSGKLPAGQAFYGKCIAIHPIFNLDAATDDDVSSFYKVMENSTFRLVIVGRQFDWEAPGCDFMPSVAKVGLAAAAVNSRVGDYIHNNWLKFDPGIAIGELVSFSVQWLIDTNATGVSTALTALAATLVTQLRVKMKGTLIRAK
jgi:hypothetical protein